MATELQEFTQEEALKKKIRQKKRIRGCLIVLNALLLCYFSYLVVDTIVQKVVEKKQEINNEIIQLNGKSSSKSKEIYEKYIYKTVDVNDFATYGKYLLTSSSRVSYDDLHFENEIKLINLLEDNFTAESKFYFNLGSKLDEQLDLFSLDVGDYMICTSITQTKGIAYHYTGDDLLEITLYSFPDELNHRKKITIRGKESSPALVISIEAINLLPKDNYDFVVIGNESELPIFKNTNYQVKYVTTLKEAYLTNASYAINLLDEEDTIISSNYVSLDTKKPDKIIGSAYDSLDSENSIRELGGYVFNAGYGAKKEVGEDISKASLEIKSTGKEVRKGKYTLSVGKKITLKDIESLLGVKNE